ncbi:hypothetical protein HK405_000584, partial [Cladochytrium tenue]
MASSIKGIHLVPPTDEGHPPAFIFETGPKLQTVVRGTVLVENSSSKPLKDVQVVVGLRGIADFNYRPEGKPDLQQLRSKLVSLEDSLFDSSTGGSLPPGNATLPFSFTLKPGAIPPSFSSAALSGPASVSYSLKAVVIYKAGLASKSKEATVTVTIVSSGQSRASLLAMQSPLAVSNVKSSVDEDPFRDDVSTTSSNINSDDVQYLMNIRRRSYIVGEAVSAEIALSRTPKHRIEFVSLSVRGKFKVKTSAKSVDVELPAYVLSLAKDPEDPSAENTWNTAQSSSRPQSINSSMSRLSLNGAPTANKTIEVVIPEGAPPSIETGLFSYSYVVRLTIKAENIVRPLIV